MLALLLLILLAAGSSTPAGGKLIDGVRVEEDEERWWWVLVNGAVFAGPFVSESHVRKAVRAYKRGELSRWHFDFFASPHGRGYWAWKLGQLHGPFESEADAEDFVEEWGG